MINFFRKIRFKLMEKDQTGTYFKYAFGEIGLVVIGILIALSINNWNELRKSNKLKSIYLESFSNELAYDIQMLNYLNGVNDSTEKAGLMLLSFLEGNPVTQDSLYIYHALVFSQYKPAFSPASSTYNDLLNSGNNKLFKDVALKKMINGYYSPNPWLDKLDDRINQTMWYDFRDELMKYIDPTIFKVAYQLNLSYPNVELEDLMKYEVDWQGLKNSVEVKKQLKAILAFRIAIREYYFNQYLDVAQTLFRKVNK